MAPSATGRVFISYRRQETAWPARQLYEVLAARFGPERVFKDVNNIEPGDDFVDRITEAVTSCDVLLALIGTQWLTMTDETGQRRLDNPDDFVRLEITAALSRGVRVIPILVDGAAMPRVADLPAELAALTRRQAVAIDPVGFNTERLLATLTEALAVTSARAPVTPPLPADPSPWSQPTDAPAEPPREPARTPIAEAASPTAEPAQPTPEPAQPTPEPAQPTPEPAQPTPEPAQQNPEPAIPTPVFPEPAPESLAGPSPAPAPSRKRWGLLAAAVAAAALIVALVVLRPWAPAAGTVAGPAPMTPAVTAPVSPDASATTTATSEPPTTPTPVDVAAAPSIVAHRGGLEVHQFETQQAMEAAALKGYGVETDVRYTSDGVAVLVHDEEASKGLDCGGKNLLVSQTTWSQLRKTCRSKPTAQDPKTYEIPRYDATMEGIAAASSTAWVFPEIKTDQTAAQVASYLDVLSKHGLRDRAVATSFSREALAKIRKEDSSMPRMLFISRNQIPVAELKGDKLWGVAVEKGIATKGYLDQLRSLDLKIMVWLLNDQRQWAEFSKLGPDIVMTGYPAKYEAWRAAK